MPKAKIDIGSDIRSQFTSAQRIVRELSKHTTAARARVMDIVNGHKFADEAQEAAVAGVPLDVAVAASDGADLA